MDLAADHQYGETCLDQHNYVIDCACDTSLCRCYRDSFETKKDVSLSCKDLAAKGHDALETLCGSPKVTACPSQLPCATATPGGAADAGASDSGVVGGGDAGAPTNCPPLPDFTNPGTVKDARADGSPGVDAGPRDAAPGDGG